MLITVRTKKGQHIIMPRHLAFFEYGFARKLANLWSDEQRREGIWEDLHRNLHNEYLHEPLLLFVGLIDYPETFFNKILEAKDDICHRNTHLLCEAMVNSDRQLISKEFNQKITNILMELWQSSINAKSQNIWR
ncbi:MAG: hypothetical protein KJ737_01575, partial [Proteobacteria bacterium]|nr:hypothetical protein [Pseudomonadota bacterium]